MGASETTPDAGHSGAATWAWAIGSLLLVVLAAVWPLLTPAVALVLILGGVTLRREGGGAATLGTVLLAVGILLAVASVLVAVLGLAVEGGGS